MTLPDLTAKVVLVDIEGTTTSISFVHDVLFPFAKKNAGNYLLETWQTDDTKEIVKDLKLSSQFAEYLESHKSSSDVELMSEFVSYLIERDLKVTPLKTLQGLIWSKGYAVGELKGQ